MVKEVNAYDKSIPLDATVLQVQASLPMKGLVLEQRLYRTTLRLPVLPREGDDM